MGLVKMQCDQIVLDKIYEQHYRNNGNNAMRQMCSWSLYNGTTHFGRQESLAPRSATSSGKKKKLCSMRRYIWVWLISICTYIHIPWSTCTYTGLHKIHRVRISFCWTGCPKKMTKSKPKLSAVGPNFPMNMTWEHLILHSLSRKQPKKIQTQGVSNFGD